MVEKGKVKYHVIHVHEETSKGGCGIRVQLFVEDENGDVHRLDMTKPETLPKAIKTEIEKIRMSCPSKIATFTHL